MATFTATVPLNIRWNGLALQGAAGDRLRIPDALYEEFRDEVVPNIPGGVTWESRTDLVFDVTAYGAVGDGVADDYAGFQAAATAAIAAGGGCLFIPPAPVGWRISDTIVLDPASGTSFSLDIVGHMANQAIIPTWSTDGKSVFRARGWKRGNVSGVALKTSLAAGSHSRTIGWDLDADSTYQSLSNVRFENCSVSVGSGSGSAHIGWRLGHSGNYDVSYICWDTCRAIGAAALGTKGEIGWSIEGQNSTLQVWVNCQGNNLAKMVTNIPSTGGPTLGSGSLFFLGGGSEYCGVVLEYARKAHPVAFYGGRHENGTTFLKLLNSADPTLAVPISLYGTLISAFTADTQFDIQSACSLTLDNFSTDGSGGGRATPYGAAFVTINPGSSSAYCYLRASGMHYGTSPIHTVTSGDVVVDKAGLILKDSSLKTTGRA